MKKLTILAAALLTLTMLSSVSEARNSMLEAVNTACKTNYNCGICHVDPRGGGPLNAGGNGYAQSGNDPCYFCAGTCGGGCTPSAEICTDGIDNDCDGKIDSQDTDCSSGCKPAKERCGDRKDNDCDGLIDCADPNCAKNRACKQ